MPMPWTSANVQLNQESLHLEQNGKIYARLCCHQE